MEIERSDRFDPLAWWLESRSSKQLRSMALTGLKGSSKAYVVSQWRTINRGPVLVIVPTLEQAESFLEDLSFFEANGDRSDLLFPPWETLPYDEIPPHPEIIRERVCSLHSLLKGEDRLVVAPVRALMQKVLRPGELSASCLSLRAGEEIERDRLVEFLQSAGYTPVKVVEERGDFSVRGAILDVYSALYDEPLRLELDGDRIDSIRRFDPETQRSLPEGGLESILLVPAKDLSDPPLCTLLDYLPEEGELFISEAEEVEEEAKRFSSFVSEHYRRALVKRDFVSPPESVYLNAEDLTTLLRRFHLVFLEESPLGPPSCQQVLPLEMGSNEDLQKEIKAILSTSTSQEEVSPLSLVAKKIRLWQQKGMRVFLISRTSNQAERLKDLLSYYQVSFHVRSGERFGEMVRQPEGSLTLSVGPLSTGFQNPREGWMLLTEEEIFGERKRRREGRRRRGPTLASYSELRENDYVVHVDYGVGLYQGLRHLRIGATSNDYLLLEYLDGDKVYVPVDRLNLIQRYIGGDGKPPKLDKLGSRSWERSKKKAKAALAEMVKELIDLYAARKVFKGYAFSPPDRFYKEFEATFEYEETPDQMKAIQEVMKDMERTTPMDRLICGDVGYGKTEVAIRAAFRAVVDGKQVAILVPTTVLAQQHHQTFSERFKNYPVSIDVLSRFRGLKEQRQILERLKEGRVDIIIGTHRLLQNDVAFRDLGLVVIDEEHRFGVNHKEKLKQLKKLVDVISLSATPIPRTLQMAISGIRDLSLIQTPPQDRLSIRTFVVRYDDDLIREAILREFDRNGQVFFVHPRVEGIEALAAHLKRIVPEARLAIAHGQMRGIELEKVMLHFVKGGYNLLVCTSIIESGLDIPTANTIFINHAERFGLADLYQLRGRVGRGKAQAYAYLLVPGELTLSKDAMRRLRAIQELSELGSGFRLAVQDLEIRGAGNLLGPSQSGHIHAVGLELYLEMMERAVRELKGEPVVEEVTPEIQFYLPAFIPERYMEDSGDRLTFYRRLSLCRSEEEVETLRAELLDRFGRMPVEVEFLLEVIKLKILLTRLWVKRFEMTPSRCVLTFHEATPVSPEKVLSLIEKGEGRYRLTPDSKLLLEGWHNLGKNPFEAAKRLLQALA